MIVKELEDLLAEHKFIAIDEIFSTVDYGKMTPEDMVALVRVTYQARDKLPTWKWAVEMVEHEFIQRGFDSSRVLVGLVS